MATKKILNAYKNANREAVVRSDDPQALIMILLDELLRAMRSYVNLVGESDSDEARKSDHLTRSHHALRAPVLPQFRRGR